jgi:hypothetical protein
MMQKASGILPEAFAVSRTHPDQPQIQTYPIGVGSQHGPTP